MPDYLPPVVSKLTGDDSGLTSVLTRAKAAVRKFADDVDRIKATVKVDADTTGLDAKLQEIKNNAVKIKAQFDADTAGLDAKLQEVKNNAVTVKVKLDLVQTEVDRVRRRVETPAAKLKVKLDLATGTKALLTQRVQSGSIKVNIKPSMDQSALTAVKAVLRALGKRIDVVIRPQMHDASETRTRNRLDRLSRDRTVTIRTRVIGDNPGSGSGGAGSSIGWLSTLISLAPALVPIAAWAGSVAVSMAAATVAVAAFGLAVIPQIKSLGDAATAQTKYTAAVTKYGAQSSQAIAAQQAYADVLSAMPEATRQAAGGFMVLKDDFKSWSNDLSQFTMVPVERSFAVVTAILPKLNGLVEGSSLQFARLITVAGGAVTTPGFDSVSKRFSDFANKVLKNAADEVIHISRLLSEGKANGPLSSFMDYAKANGPAVKETLANIAKAVGNILQASAEAGPGMLSLVNALAKLVNALPPDVIARLMQAYTAFKLIKLASTGIGAAAGGVRTLVTQVVALHVAAAGAGGGVAGLQAAFMALSTGAKASVIVAGIAAVALVLMQLSSAGKKAPPDIDKMTTSIAKLGDTGKLSGEGLRVLGADMGNLSTALGTLDKPSTYEHLDRMWSSLIGMQSTPDKGASQILDSVDTSLTNLVKGGKADLAKVALDQITASLAAQGRPASELKGHLDNYKSALADAALEAKLTADSMGLFGNQAQQVQQKLADQKASADGLRQSIQALNDVNRQGLDGEIGFQAAIDAATKAYKDNGKALSWKNGQLQVGSEKARNEASALTDLAAKTDANTAAARDAGKSWATVNGIYKQGRDKLVAVAQQMGLTKTEAKKLADQILQTPDKTANLKGNLDDLQAKLDKAKKQLKSVPDSRKASVQARIDQLEKQIAKAKADLKKFDGTKATASLTTTYKYVTVGTPRAGIDPIPTKSAYGGVIRAFAGGGVVPGYAPMRDIVPSLMSPGEGVLIPEAVRKLGGEAGINHINRQARGSGADIAGIGSHAIAGLRQSVSGAPALGQWVGQGLALGLTGGTPGVAAASVAVGRAVVASFSAELGIQSPSKKFRTLGAYVVSGLVQGLTGTTSQVKSAAKKIANLLYTDFGSSHKGLQKTVARDNAELLKLAAQRDSVVTKLKAAQSKLSALQTSWTQERDSISSSIMGGVSVVTAANADGRALNANDVVSSLKAESAKAQQFTALLKQLKSKGLRSDLIDQIASAGVDGGYDTALALAGGTKGQISEANKAQKTAAASAKSAGTLVADAMYGAGIQSAKGLVAGLKSQQKAIEDQMMAIAKSMQKALKQALGIKSPSVVFRALGAFIPQGLARGVADATHHATTAVSNMAAAVVGVGAPRMPGFGLVGAGGGAVIHQHHHVHVEVKGHVMTERDLVDVVEEGFLKRGMRNGPTYQAFGASR